jgi:hypothetical protein
LITPLKAEGRLLNFAGCAIDTIKINEIFLEQRGDRFLWVKRRRPGSVQLVNCANWFFRLCQNPVRVFCDLEQWRRWEVDCFQLLNGDSYSAFADDATTVCADRLPGIDLATALKRSELTPAMLIAAGEEFQRIHGIWSDSFAGPWSHGDPHMGNVIYDGQLDRARLIDFETVHLSHLAPRERHADDLAVFLLDLMGRASDRDWPEMTRILLDAYGDRQVITILRERFRMPRGLRRVWWAIRTSYIPGTTLRRRLEAFHRILV